MSRENNIMKNIPLAEKYRPITINEIVGNVHIIDYFRHALADKDFTNLVLYGNSGNGKTSTIIAFARELYGEYFPQMVMDLNASDNRGVEMVRTKIRQFVSTRCVLGSPCKYKLIILDEVDSMTIDAQMMIKYMIEKHHKNARFCFITNLLHKINKALLARCLLCRYTSISEKDMIDRLTYIANSEKIPIKDNEVIPLIANSSDGDLRKAINAMQSINIMHNELSTNTISKVCYKFNMKQVKDIMSYVKTNSIKDACNYVIDTYIISYYVVDIISGIYDWLMYCRLNNKTNGLSEEGFCYLCEHLCEFERLRLYNLDTPTQIGSMIAHIKLAWNK
jgi:DNA polymerase III delta prime subunit